MARGRRDPLAAAGRFRSLVRVWRLWRSCLPPIDEPLPGWALWAEIPSLPGRGIAVYREARRDAWVSPTLFAKLPWEPTETAFLQRVLPRAQWFLDVGANLGWYTVLARHFAAEGALVAAIEPARDNLALLRRTLAQEGLRDVVCLGVAASERAGRLRLYHSGFNQGDHRLQDASGSDGSWEEVPVVRLDALFAGVLRGPGIIKLDVQGHEVKALRGLSGVLEDPESPALVLAELWPWGLERQEGAWQAMLDALPQADCYGLIEKGAREVRWLARAELEREVEARWRASTDPTDWYCNVVAAPPGWGDGGLPDGRIAAQTASQPRAGRSSPDGSPMSRAGA